MTTKQFVLAALVAAGLGAGGATLLTGQQANTGSPAQAYQAPRTVEGLPDFHGVWQAVNSASWDIEPHAASWGVPPGLGVVDGNEIPYQPWARTQKAQNFRDRETADPDRRCFYPGVPRIMYIPHPFQIVQNTDVFELIFEYGHYTRLIYLNGFPHHEDIPFWMGDSRGRWDGDTLVVDTRNFNGMTWFDKAGNFHSDAMRLLERFTRTGPDHFQWEATIEDPKVFTRPWTMRMPFYRLQEPDAMPLEYECIFLDVYENRRYHKLAGDGPDQ